MDYVVIGAGPAGVIAAETLRRTDPAGSVKLVGDEPEAPYSRMAIPISWPTTSEEGGTHLRHGANHYRQALGIDVVQEPGSPASRRRASRWPLENGAGLGLRPSADRDRVARRAPAGPGHGPARRRELLDAGGCPQDRRRHQGKARASC